MELVMGRRPTRPGPALEAAWVSESVQDGYRLAEISYRAEAEDRVSAYLLTPSRPVSELPGVVCLHQTTSIGKAEPAGLGGKPNLHYAAELAKLGYVAIVPDYPGFGGYKFDPYAHGYASATMKGIWNHMRAVDLLAGLPEVDARRIGAIGHSLGGHNALFLAAFDERIKAVVTSCGFTSFGRYMGGDLTGWSHNGYMPRIAKVYGKSPSRMPFDFSDVLEAILPRPVFVNAPLNDSNFDAAGVDECVEAALRAHSGLPGSRIDVHHPAAGHDFPPEIRRAAYDFLARSLTGREPRAGAPAVTRCAACRRV